MIMYTTEYLEQAQEVLGEMVRGLSRFGWDVISEITWISGACESGRYRHRLDYDRRMRDAREANEGCNDGIERFF